MQEVHFFGKLKNADHINIPSSLDEYLKERSIPYLSKFDYSVDDVDLKEAPRKIRTKGKLFIMHTEDWSSKWHLKVRSRSYNYIVALTIDKDGNWYQPSYEEYAATYEESRWHLAVLNTKARQHLTKLILDDRDLKKIELKPFIGNLQKEKGIPRRVGNTGPRVKQAVVA